MHEGNGSGGSSLPTAIGGGIGFKVNKDNVLKIAKTVQDQADWLKMEINVCERDMRTAPAREDPVSKDVAQVLNEKLIDNADSYVKRARDYALELENAVQQMKAAAKDYGYSDEQIAGVLNGEGGSGA
ncbi:hypothetical protein JOF53_000656 [Crossiella equi]|uniref:PE family protein n=1 Tax=Crossiella equi TaxID=130796 RepID=A0ABS5A5B5_9PSEU|nr:hypothetical protein [Crossiella equi]MBP2471784.1 hypothetical protein [Crossiella equi]